MYNTLFRLTNLYACSLEGKLAANTHHILDENHLNVTKNTLLLRLRSSTRVLVVRRWLIFGFRSRLTDN